MARPTNLVCAIILGQLLAQCRIADRHKVCFVDLPIIHRGVRQRQCSAGAPEFAVLAENLVHLGDGQRAIGVVIANELISRCEQEGVEVRLALRLGGIEISLMLGLLIIESTLAVILSLLESYLHAIPGQALHAESVAPLGDRLVIHPPVKDRGVVHQITWID
ncbi:hypothetical protein A9972_21785 [Pseudomonas sp. UME83]|nr:hypothetical protein [Pseudomonas sp. UMC76]MBB1640671.1 hypothetical protein [Pseudomonas sp. UME83]